MSEKMSNIVKNIADWATIIVPGLLIIGGVLCLTGVLCLKGVSENTDRIYQIVMITAGSISEGASLIYNKINKSKSK